MVGDFLKALGQIGDPRFARVLGIGLALTVGLLFLVTALLVTVVGWFAPEVVTLPWVGWQITWIDNALSWAIVPLMLVLSVFLMVPVASAFTSIFLDEVADAVEGRHYPHLAQAPRSSFADSLIDGLRFLGVIVAANLAALLLYLAVPPAAPVIFLLLNGYLLGREYFTLVAMRRLGRDGARAARSRHAGRIWIAGTLMAVPLTIPLLNLLVPVLGAATFTHFFHRVEKL
ncbi:EI24 domain-containing protein [Palleronia sp. KMU-117]|uniref:EI24 domain-containing protein n=1 Tax=Palleronia sp. KMU-117 TaxID=3434108 RepID=UPI003D7213E0